MSDSQKVLVTGSTGFVGQRLCAELRTRGFDLREAVRHAGGAMDGREIEVVGAISDQTDWRPALEEVRDVIHLAGRAHVMREKQADSLSAYRAVNLAATAHLARAAAAAGVRRFVFVSSIKANGEVTGDQPFRETDIPAPLDSYGVTKLEAEAGLIDIGRETGMEIVVVRPALVYGPGVKGNFLQLLQWVQRGLPLPLGACANLRSFLGLSNLVDLLICCMTHPRAAGQTFLAADGQDISTPELVRRMAMALGVNSRLVRVPPAWLRLVAGAIGRPGIYQRLCESLQVDITHAKEVLGWVPSVSIDRELAETADWFLRRHS